MAESQWQQDNVNDPMQSSMQVRPAAIVASIVFILAVIFIVQNTETLMVEFLMFDIEMPLWLLMVMMLVAGALIGQAAVWYRARNKRKKAAQKKH